MALLSNSIVGDAGPSIVGDAGPSTRSPSTSRGSVFRPGRVSCVAHAIARATSIVIGARATSARLVAANRDLVLLEVDGELGGLDEVASARSKDRILTQDGIDRGRGG